jgi:hypothetical protein
VQSEDIIMPSGIFAIRGNDETLFRKTFKKEMKALGVNSHAMRFVIPFNSIVIENGYAKMNPLYNPFLITDIDTAPADLNRKRLHELVAALNLLHANTAYGRGPQDKTPNKTPYHIKAKIETVLKQYKNL